MKAFVSTAFPRLVLRSGHKQAEFKNGYFETDDTDLIAECEASPFVYESRPTPRTTTAAAEPAATEPTVADEAKLDYYMLAKRTTKEDALRYCMERDLDVDPELTREDFIAAVNEAQKDKL